MSLVDEARKGRRPGLEQSAQILIDQLETCPPTVVAQVAGQYRAVIGELYAEKWIDQSTYRVGLSACRDYLAVAAGKLQDDERPGVGALLAQVIGQLRMTLHKLGTLPVEDQRSARERLAERVRNAS